MQKGGWELTVVSTIDVRQRIGDMLNRVALRHDEFVIERKGEPLAALVPIERLERAAAVATGCALGIAATGTIVLDAEEAQGRRALTLIPDHHICVIFADQIVDTVPQAFAALNPAHPLTFISGPSATSDIELERVEGVHGPRTLDVLVVAATHPQTAPIRPT